MGSAIRITFESLEHFQQAFETTLSHGGAFAPGATGVKEAEEVDVAIVHPVSQVELVKRARVVMVVPADTGGGVGIELLDFGPDTRAELAMWIVEHNYPAPHDAGAQPERQPEPEPKRQPEPERQPEQRPRPARPAATRGDRSPINVHERLRNLSMAEQIKMARDGDVNERTVLERIYGKSVWEPLLRNPRLTAPEVMRIARMPALPRPLLETIVANPAWLSSPQVRRALLSNRRLSGDQVQKVLRATPKPELKMMQKQTAYPANVRAAAKKLLNN